MKSAIVKRSILRAGRNTSVSLEDAFWKSLKDIAQIKRKLLSELIGEIDAARGTDNLSSAIRQFVLNHYLARGAAARLDALEFRPRIPGLSTQRRSSRVTVE
jgi:predicted DNA-binding ribbon-helix-helix protein